MQLGPSSGAKISDGLMAAMVLLSEKPRQGVPSRNPALHPGIDERNSTVALGLRAGEQLNRVRSRYTGKERDTESGNDYFGARYYANSMGRFMSPDWSALPVGVPYASISDPQTLNLYAYGLNNPLRNRDLDGHQCTTTSTVTYSNGGEDAAYNVNITCTPDWWQFQGVRSWIGNHPKTVKTTFGVVNAATVISGLIDGGASEFAVPEELAGEEAILEAGELAAEEGAEAGGVESAANAANSPWWK
jgi:RHS repeat-associated protein